MDLFVIIGRCEISISFGSFAHIETDLFINGQTLMKNIINLNYLMKMKLMNVLFFVNL